MLKIRITVIILFITSAITIVYAQGGPPPDPNDIPLDPLSWLILAAGGAIGAKKYFFDKKGEDNNP
jgi:hypothetical protein